MLRLFCVFCIGAIMFCITNSYSKTRDNLKENILREHIETALIKSIMDNSLDAAKKEIKKGKKTVEASDTEGRTALILAAARNLNVISELLKAGANVNTVDKKGETALMKAAMFKSSSYKIPTEVAAEKKINAEIFKALADYKKTKVNITNKDGKTALIMAIEHGKPELAEFLIRKTNTDVNVIDKSGVTALMVAAYRGYDKLVKLLLEKANCVNVADADGDTALMRAASAGNYAIVKMLLEKGAQASMKNKKGEKARDMVSKYTNQAYAEIGRLLKMNEK